MPKSIPRPIAIGKTMIVKPIQKRIPISRMLMIILMIIMRKDLVEISMINPGKMSQMIPLLYSPRLPEILS